MRATREQRDRLLADFIRYCEIESPSRSERPMTDAITDELRGMGLEVVEDATRDDTGSNAGNILARIAGPEGEGRAGAEGGGAEPGGAEPWGAEQAGAEQAGAGEGGAEQAGAEPGAGARTILLCAHLDTVPLDAPVDIEHDEEGWIRNRNDAILGADNKAAVAVIMETARHLTANGAPVGVELLFTVCEELALLGASAFDQDRLKAEFGFVFDHATPIGEIIIAAPTYYQLDVTFHGKAAHAGMRPEDGHNAIAAAAAGLSALEFGRLDKQTTANVGVIKGGNQGNVVPDRCDMILETRSLDHERAFAHAQHMVDELTAAASDHQCDVDIDLQELFRGYKLAKTAPQVEAAARALEANRIEPVYINTGGGSDANAFILGGLPCVNMANGTVNPHQHDEAVTVQALETMLDVVLTLVEECAR